ncbi:X-ray repair cross-complementing protein 5-like [Achroia grisella]|uniref:X-ray repair cross-complementing protein 5-like n=1 Tax=Achroia grisella TaxID=688607 RepID=UPI0027D2C618|nr:X-ray repair cross-complementing protein 5-like [Achroia grisella]XP_059050649.1 X-ray repair cross-complementing protein 5-like [Achroia grisella]
MPPKIDQASIIILDIGKNVALPDEKVGSFFDKAKACAARVLERKIMNQGKSLVGLILLGSKKTQNNMAKSSDGNFKYIEMLAELQSPSWEMIRNLPNTPSNKKGDWIDALIVAADHFKNGISGVKIAEKKIILMTNFKAPTYADAVEIEQVCNGFKEEEFEVDVIGPDIYEDFEKFEGDYKIARHFVENTGGATATFDNTMRYLLFHKKKSVGAMPWNVDLSIGPNIKIPVSSFIKSKDEPAVKKWGKAVKDSMSNTASSAEAILKHKTYVTENQTVIQNDDITKGYYYGQYIIPNSNIYETPYESGEKCLSVYGFTDVNNIKWENLNGNGISYVFGRKDDKKAQYAVRCLVECLLDQNLAAIARRVYNKGNAPKMYALFPVIDTNNYICLSMIEICYKEDIKYMAFPVTNLKKYECTNKQVEGFKNLIKAMNLSNAYDETYDDREAFPIAETVSPSVQYILDCIAFRAMNPEKPLPQPRDDIMMLFKVPPLVEKRSRDPLNNLKDLFILKKIEHRVKNQKDNRAPLLDSKDDQTIVEFKDPSNDIPKVHLNAAKGNEVIGIGTENPIMDFETLLDKHQTVPDLSSQMSTAIERLFYSNFDGNFGKALNTLTYFRNKCVQTDPSCYNNWYMQYKISLAECSNDDILKVINDKKLGFILKEENVLSTYESPDSHEESQLYENDTVPDMTEVTVKSDVHDMFDEM